MHRRSPNDLSLWKSLSALLVGAAFGLAVPGASAAEALKIETFNPGAKSLFPVASTLVTGPTEAILIDAQFQGNDALTVLQMIKDSRKNLTAIYISHGDPDFYFGLDVITAAFPDAKVYASPSTFAHIQAEIEAKISYWGPILAENAPETTVMPRIIESDTFTVDGQELKYVGLDGHDPKHTYVWISSTRTVAGGVILYEGVHVWMADTKTPKSRDAWRRSLANLLSLQPNRIIPGHLIGDSSEDTDAILFTLEYVAAFEQEAAEAEDAAALIEAMKARYSDFTNTADLELSAKVVMAEMTWP